jgi:hypothetical protein
VDGFRLLNGQIQYGSARQLTVHPTRGRRLRPLALFTGLCLLLGVLLTAAPREVPGVALAVTLGGAWLTLILAMTLPRNAERAGQDRVRRLAQFRHELNAIGDAPTPAALQRLLARPAELGLRHEEVEEELGQVRAAIEALELQARIARGDMPGADPPDPLAPGDVCHFVAAVRFGRRRSDQFGHLVLTAGWMKFRGALDVSVAWSEVASVRRDGPEIVIRLQDSRRVLRFSCGSYAEAARGGVIADHLARAARDDAPSEPAACHASY